MKKKNIIFAPLNPSRLQSIPAALRGSLGIGIDMYLVRIEQQTTVERPIFYSLNTITTYEKVIHYGLCGGHVDRMREGNHE
jgi:hypothetical protein